MCSRQSISVIIITGRGFGNRFYVKATATIYDGSGNHVENVAFAREDEQKKGMDGSQITGTASSYARKYALNGLLLIDDTKDADTDPPFLANLPVKIQDFLPPQ